MSAAVRRVERHDEAVLQGLADVLVDCVDGGASVSFMAPLTRERALPFWRDVVADALAGKRLLFVAEDAEGVCGTVQVLLDMPENQPHRGDVLKMLVHRRARRRGVGEALMRAAEDGARAAGKTLLVLDTASGDAERLYERLGWENVGVVPDYALLPQGGFCQTRFYFKRLA